MRLPSEAAWVIVPKPDHQIERIGEPIVLDLDQAIDWIKEKKPIVWSGSIFSVPEPSGFPSGAALTRSLLSMVLANTLPEDQVEQLIDSLMPRWPLEALLDEFEFVGFDLSTSLLDYFKGVNDVGLPNPLHNAIASYYQKGLAGKPLCITTNWDTLQEKAFRKAGYAVITAGPAEFPQEDFGEAGNDSRLVFVYHSHGSFDGGDVVCSYKQEQRQLSLPVHKLAHPTLYLGYSGYEPSLYATLERTEGLWCIRDSSDLDIPAKRRLLCRPDTFVYVGDVRELLHSLDLLHEEVDLKSKFVQYTGLVPPKVIEVVQLSIAASVDLGLCTDM